MQRGQPVYTHTRTGDFMQEGEKGTTSFSSSLRSPRSTGPGELA